MLLLGKIYLGIKARTWYIDPMVLKTQIPIPCWYKKHDIIVKDTRMIFFKDDAIPTLA